MKQFNSGPSINTYNKLSHWFDFSNPGILKVYSGKIDIGQHISSTLALIASKITQIKYDQIEIIKLSTDISPNEGITASSLSVANSGSAIKAASITLKINFINLKKTFAINTFFTMETLDIFIVNIDYFIFFKRIPNQTFIDNPSD